jgi:hypothetical protein
MKKVNAESWSVMTTPEVRDLDAPYLPTGVDSEPEVHPKSEILLNAGRIKLNAAKRLASTLKHASIMPSNQATDNDTHISSVEDVDEKDLDE